MKKNIAVFCSGGGTNFQSIIDAAEANVINAKIVALIAGKDNIFAIERAKKHNIPYFIFNKNDFELLEKMYDEIILKLKSLQTDLIVFAGYLTVVTPNFVNEFKNKIINIHPSLIPAYCGKGFYGLKVHQAVIDNKEKMSGCTVHYVDEGTDTGRVLAQTKVTVLPDDTAETLQQRILEQEHKLLVEVIKQLAGI